MEEGDCRGVAGVEEKREGELVAHMHDVYRYSRFGQMAFLNSFAKPPGIRFCLNVDLFFFFSAADRKFNC